MFNRRGFLAAMTLGALAGLAGCSGEDKLENLRGVALTDSALGKGFALNGTDGQAHTLADFKGKVVMVFFGFTQCPDVCPTALIRAVEVKQKLGERGKNLQVLFVTVDPERDTPEVLSAYVTAFDPSFIGLYGSPDQTRATAKEYKVYYSKIPTGSSYTMDHTALSYVYDAEGKLRVALRHNQPIDDFVNDIGAIMDLHG
ncbi:SCO family protein [Bordetella petrii]|uniref:SCO family protein n=1 Tax=Bordetella petrii TaxID=94624 RepID=A0ABT7W6Z7_9BORD|nr:SCO family protein [Bordetella petrii]MDM9560967.1 SCO family protein [Bordetella petrii]